VLSLDITLDSVNLSVVTSGGDHGFASIADPSMILDTLASDSYFAFIGDGQSLTIPSLTLVSGNFDLVPGFEYELAVDVSTGAGVVPEPRTWSLLAVGAFFLLLVDRGRRLHVLG
jgi:hypothetical protein